MEDRIPQRQDPQDPIAGDTATLPSPAEARSGDGDDAAVLSGDETETETHGEFEFEFPFVSRDSPAGTAALADELFADGRIRPFYPVFGRAGCRGGGGVGSDHAGAAAAPRTRGPLGQLFLEESRSRNPSTSSTASTSSSAATDEESGLDGAPPESYCLWAPGSGAPRPPKKSSSTGSMVRWRRISELVVGRSHSDGKEKFLFLPTPPPPPPPPKESDREDGSNKPKPKPRSNPPGAGNSKKPPPAAADADTVTAAYRVAHGEKLAGAPRRTFLPYREELVGFFANVNGISRSHPHPF